MAINKFGLLGKSLKHSFSPEIHKFLGDYSYDLFEVEEEGLGTFFDKTDAQGFNVTIPYKKEVMKYLDEISPIAKKIGAVNTVVRRKNGFYGTNTDYYGFKYLIEKNKIEIENKKVLVLGSGGASVTVLAVLDDLNAKEVINISRSGNNNYENISKHSDANIIVNTTPVGMYPNTGNSPIDFSIFANLEVAIDIIYNPLLTKFLYEGEIKKAKVTNGLCMLVAQAKEAAEIFTEKSISDDVLTNIISSIAKDKSNIILVGMPGCGKTTVGKSIANLLNREFVDIDELIFEKYSISPGDIIRENGEAYFREIETKLLKDEALKTGRVISTGGGAVTISENRYYIRENGLVVYIKRDLEALSTDGRPLSGTLGVEELYKIRKGLYEEVSDIEVDNNKVDVCANEIVRFFNEKYFSD